MNNFENRCLDVHSLRRLLEDQLPSHEEAPTLEHLASCEECQSQLDQMATRGRGWEELQNNLSDLSLDNTFNFTEDETYHEPIELTNVLGPTDHPESLGRLGRYEIYGLIGRGSTGVVFKGHDLTLNRFIAIKMLVPDLAYRGSSRKRFEREARAIAAVSHPNVIEVHGVDNYRDRSFFVMQYFPNGSLQNRISREGWMTTTEVCQIGMQIARGLSEAHRQGIIHRDIKPANILLENGTERAVVTDFGLASVADEVKVTATGIIAGTPQYMSPEQACGKTLDARTDLFSLGCVMYAACTGRPPFDGETLMGVVHDVCNAKPKSIRELNPDIAPWMQAFIERLLCKAPDGRFQTAEDVDKILTSELAYMRMPGAMDKPNRRWWVSEKPKPTTKLAGWGLAVSLFLLVTLILAWMLGGKDDIAANRYGITPTRQEQTMFEAQAVYDLAYQTHVSEFALRGDMAKSINAHQKSLDRAYDPGRTAYLLACAHAVERDINEAIAWLEKAYLAGFHDYDAAVGQSELNPLRSDSRFKSLLARVKDQQEKRTEAESAYFKREEYELAERLFRARLKECPQDEHAIMMIGAALLEQGKIDESIPWNEKTRHSVRFANFGVYNLGCAAAQQGRFDMAFNYLRYSTELGFTDANHLENDHHLIPIRDDPRFEQLLKTMRR